MAETDPRVRIYDIFAAPDLDFEAKVDRALDVGCEYLNLPIGFLTRIDDVTQEIVQSSGDHPLIQSGETCPLDRAYCRRTVEIDSPLAVQHADASADISRAAIDTFDLGAYIGATVTVRDETYGTICFAAEERRETSFSDAETHFIELLAKLVGQEIERRAYRRALDDRAAELDKRQEIYRAVIDASFDLVFRIDRSGEFTYLSPPIESLLGYSPEEFLGQPFVAMLPDEETIALATDMFEGVLSGQVVEEFYFPLEHRAGDQVLVDVRVVPIYDAEVRRADRTPADIVGVQGMARDASERRQRERLIQVLNRVLRHNLRNGMNVISGYADTLRERSSGKDARLAARIIERSDDLTQLSDTARQLERTFSASADIRTMDLVPIVRRTAEQVADAYPGAAVNVSTPERLRARSAPELSLALWELLENAATHAGETPTIELSCAPDERQAVVRVTDDGPGLPEQERAVLESGKETPLVHGSGLGLWLVYWVVESLDAELDVRDAAPGTTIEIRLRQEIETDSG